MTNSNVRRTLVPHGFVPAVLLALGAAAGCGPPTGSVTGTVKYNGKLVAGATVELTPPTGRPIETTTGPDGLYGLKDVPAGEARVAVVTVSAEFAKARDQQAEPSAREKFDKDVSKTKGMKYSLLPEKYSAASTTPLRVTVQSGENKFDVELVD
jgi:hypothetical protein